ncbi:Uncharacterized protein Rs2_05486 [Raphanus sativus]|nr:Uncharacterized protein Rs2_05486 [Raphanus sativus]
MFRPKKKKEPTLMEELKERNLLEEGDVVDIPELENDDLIEENSLSVVVRCLNPTMHKVGALVKALPPIWGLEDRVKGRGVGDNQAQFIFQCERDLQFVLSKGPWFVNGWIVALDQWSPNPGPDFLKLIPFWVRIRGIPVHLLKKQTVEGLFQKYAKVDSVVLHAKNSDSLEYVRARAWIKADEPLQFRRSARFKSGELISTELEYEKLLKVCFTCKKLTHDQNICPNQIHTLDHDSGTAGGQMVRGAKAMTSKQGGKGKGKEKGLLYPDSDDIEKGGKRPSASIQTQSEHLVSGRTPLSTKTSRASKRGEPKKTTVWRKKDNSQESSRGSRGGEGGSSNSVGDSIHSGRKTPSQERRRSIQERIQTPPSVFQRLRSGSGSKEKAVVKSSSEGKKKDSRSPKNQSSEGESSHQRPTSDGRIESVKEEAPKLQ